MPGFIGGLHGLDVFSAVIVAQICNRSNVIHKFELRAGDHRFGPLIRGVCGLVGPSRLDGDRGCAEELRAVAGLIPIEHSFRWLTDWGIGPVVERRSHTHNGQCANSCILMPKYALYCSQEADRGSNHHYHLRAAQQELN